MLRGTPSDDLFKKASDHGWARLTQVKENFPTSLILPTIGREGPHMDNEVEEAGRSLSGLRVFAGIPSAILAKIGSVCAWHQIDATEVIVDSASMRPHGVYFLVDGVVEVLTYGCDDQLISVAELEAPECFDDLDLISGKAGSASIRARTDCVVAQMPGDRFYSFLRACPCISLDLLEKVVSISDILGAKGARPDQSGSSGYSGIQPLV